MTETLMRAALGVLTSVVLQASNCTSGVGVGVDVNADGVNVDVNVDAGGGGSSGAVPSDSVRVRFVNQSPYALDVEFHAAESAGEDIAAALFVAENEIREGLGFAGTGLIDKNGSDDLTLPCADVAVVGTLGGRFVNPDGGQLIGTGRQRLAVKGLQYTCGETITFVFDDAGSAFTTSLVIR